MSYYLIAPHVTGRKPNERDFDLDLTRDGQRTEHEEKARFEAQSLRDEIAEAARGKAGDAEAAI